MVSVHVQYQMVTTTQTVRIHVADPTYLGQGYDDDDGDNNPKTKNRVCLTKQGPVIWIVLIYLYALIHHFIYQKFLISKNKF